MICNLCPRKCNAERNDSVGKGYCKMPKSLYVSRVAHHYWEEPVISGKKGTVAVFFTGCTLDCIYCQNREISHNNLGRKVTIDELAKEVTLLLDKGAESLSFITPSHYTNGIIQLLDIISPTVPVVYNTSGFDSIETLKKLEGYIDIYLPDLKYSNNDLGLKYSNVRNYFDITSKAIEEMVRQTGKPVINQDGIMEKGTMVRNLVLPSHTKNSIEVINYLAEKYGDKILFSLMGQYIPYGDAKNHKKLHRKITKREYEKVLLAFESSGLNGYCQELSSASEKYIPEWDSDVL
ncbi:radical SAM protein [Ruminococcus sp.]|uniref:radical SAM protein n=1 Tax=Ruminococcus sp. TaxID=41978 RepID=UPI002E8092BC|nr:radical SAM protein [Ruminococcus sp.]MEE3439211.1 radical SAM protein [Ruminococcus sp.]